MGCACSTMGRGEVCTGIWWGNLRETARWGDPGVNRRIILGFIFKMWEVVVRTGLGWLRIGPGGGRLWVRWGTFGFHKTRGSSWLVVKQLLKRDSAPWSKKVSILMKNILHQHRLYSRCFPLWAQSFKISTNKQLSTLSSMIQRWRQLHVSNFSGSYASVITPLSATNCTSAILSLYDVQIATGTEFAL
jgi:hypothetical protein